MIKKSDIVKNAVRDQDWKKALQIAKDFRIGVTREERDKMARAYECMVYPDFYRQIGTDIRAAIEQGKSVVEKYVKGRTNNMKWDIKHDKAKGIIDAALNEAEMWFTDKEKIAGLTEQEVGEVNKELTTMIESIRKRYKLQERLAEQEPHIQPKEDGVVISTDKEEKTTPEPVNEDKETEKPKRSRKVSTGEKKAPSRRKKKEVQEEEQA